MREGRFLCNDFHPKSVVLYLSQTQISQIGNLVGVQVVVLCAHLTGQMVCYTGPSESVETDTKNSWQVTG